MHVALEKRLYCRTVKNMFKIICKLNNNTRMLKIIYKISWCVIIFNWLYTDLNCNKNLVMLYSLKVSDRARSCTTCEWMTRYSFILLTGDCI